MPTDPQTVNDFDESELVGVLSEIEMILDKSVFGDCVWAGDFNWHRERNTAFSRNMERFVSQIGLFSVWERNPVDYTHIHTDNKSVTTLDHFLVKPYI